MPETLVSLKNGHKLFFKVHSRIENDLISDNVASRFGRWVTTKDVRFRKDDVSAVVYYPGGFVESEKKDQDNGDQ